MYCINELTFLPSAEDEATKCGKEEPCLKARVKKVNSLQILSDFHRYRIVERS